MSWCDIQNKTVIVFIFICTLFPRSHAHGRLTQFWMLFIVSIFYKLPFKISFFFADSRVKEAMNVNYHVYLKRTIDNKIYSMIRSTQKLTKVMFSIAEFIIKSFLVENKLIYKKSHFINYILNQNVILIIDPLGLVWAYK